MCPPPSNTTIKLDNSPKCSAKKSGQNQECWIFFNLYPPPLWDIEDRRRWGHNVEDSDIEDRQRWGQATLRTNSSPNTFPNPGPEGPTETLQLTYILKCWQHISNKICSFPKQKPSKLHIFSKCWQHISNKNIHPPNDGIIYPIFLTIFDNFWKFWQFCKVGFWWVLQNNICPQSRDFEGKYFWQFF